LIEIKIKSIYGSEADIIEEAQSKGKLKFKFHTDQFPLNKLGIRVCDICIEIDDSKKELENQNNVYPKLLN
jgi:hypothetical protein